MDEFDKAVTLLAIQLAKKFEDEGLAQELGSGAPGLTDMENFQSMQHATSIQKVFVHLNAPMDQRTFIWGLFIAACVMAQRMGLEHKQLIDLVTHELSQFQKIELAVSTMGDEETKQ